jgi:hypothetical protein
VILVSRLVAARTALKSQIPRILNLMATVLLAGGIAVSGWATSGGNVEDLSTYSNIFLVFFGTLLLLRLLPLVYYSVLGRIEVVRETTNATYYLADVLLVYFLNGVRFVLSLFDIMTGLQAQLLFNTAYARQVSSLMHSCISWKGCGSSTQHYCWWLSRRQTLKNAVWVLGCLRQTCTWHMQHSPGCRAGRLHEDNYFGAHLCACVPATGDGRC